MRCTACPAEAGFSPSSRLPITLQQWEQHEAELLDSGMPEHNETELPGVLQIPPADKTVVDEVWSRGKWLLGLLVLQSTSSFVLDSYQQLLKDHIVVTLFLTMLVGAGGNAGAAGRACMGLVRKGAPPAGLGLCAAPRPTRVSPEAPPAALPDLAAALAVPRGGNRR